MRITVAAVVALFALFNSLTGLPAVAQQLPPVQQMLQVDVKAMTPRIISATDESLTITVRVRNTATVPVRNLAARLQLGSRQQTNHQLRQALRGSAPQDAQSTPFQPASPELLPGESTEFTLLAELHAETPNGIAFLEPGVYPLLVNINGTPDKGAEARLAAVNVLLPVQSTHAGPMAPAAQTQQVSMLWPIASRPRVAAQPINGSLVLIDDTLAAEVRPGGRLYSLVSAAEHAKDTGAIADGLCFAVDPDLVSTVRSMTNGYRVRTNQGLRRGEGAEDAKAWLSSLRDLVKDHCVVATPLAGADLAALAGRSPRLATAAADRNSVLAELLETEPLPGVIWTTGSLDDQSAKAVSEAQKELVISNAKGFADRMSSAEPRAVHGGGAPNLRVMPYDELAALALTPGSASTRLGFPATVAADDLTIAAQNAVATVLFRVAEAPDGPLLIAPPRVWNAAPEEFEWMLRTLSELARDDLIQPVSLATLAQASPSGSAQLGMDAVGGKVPARVTGAIAQLNDQLTDLLRAMDADPSSQVEPETIVRPLREAMMRAASVDFQGVRGGRKRALELAEAQLRAVQNGVRISDPGRTISLASGASPIPVSVTNRLPVQVTVQVNLTASSGLRLSQASAVEVPAGRSRNLKIPAEVLRAGRFTVDVHLTTPGGTPLGEPARFELTSTEYGVITVIVTATAAGALLLLAGRRIYRRLRSNGADRGQTRTE